MNRFALGLLFLFSILSVFAQNQSTEDRVIDILHEAEKTSNLDSVVLLTKKAYDLAIAKGNDSLKAALTFHLSQAYYNISQFDTAKAFANKADSIANTHKLYLWEYRAKTRLAAIYAMQKNSNATFDLYNKALEIAHKTKDSTNIGDAFNNMGNAYLTVEKFAEAEKYLKKALDIYNRINLSESEKLITYKNLARSVSNIEDSEKYMDLAYKVVQEENNAFKSSAFYLTAGEMYRQKGFFDKSIESFEKSIQIAQKGKIIQVEVIGYAGKGVVQKYRRDFKNAIKTLNKALSYPELGISNRLLVLEELAHTYRLVDDYKNAYDTMDLFNTITDSIQNVNWESKYAEYDVKYNSAQKDIDIANQKLEIEKQERAKYQIIFIGIILILIVAGIFQNYLQRQKRKKEQAEAMAKKEKEHNDMRTKFLGNIAHEIRTPLTLINGHLDLTLEKERLDPAVKNHVLAAKSSSNQVLENVNEILDLIKFGDPVSNDKDTNIVIDSFLKRNFLSFESLAASKNIVLSYESAIPDDLIITSSEKKIERILNNLVTNALKFSNSDGRIDAKAKVQDNTIEFSIQDYGLGIPKSELDSVFKRFYQTKEGQKVGGIGIGLSLSKEFAESLNGTLSVDSERNAGATFTLTFPFTKGENTETAKESPTIAVEDKHPISLEKRERILIVEDNLEMSRYLKEILTPYYDCDVAFNGMEALQKVQQQSYGLITSDIMMPNMDGYEFKTKVNNLDKTKYIPFIFISAKALDEDKLVGFELGVDDYITKPFSKQELIARMKSLLHNKQRREEWAINHPDLVIEENSFEDKLLFKIRTLVYENLDDRDYKVDQLSKDLGYSSRQLNRILKKQLGLSPVQYILEIRLAVAYNLIIKKQKASISEVRAEVGISSTSYFNQKFEERFGIKPKKLLEQTS